MHKPARKQGPYTPVSATSIRFDAAQRRISPLLTRGLCILEFSKQHQRTDHDECDGDDALEPFGRNVLTEKTAEHDCESRYVYKCAAGTEKDGELGIRTR